MSKKVGLAIFVKTPGLSPVKTRLAKSIGNQTANDFYDKALAVTTTLVKKAVMQVQGLEIFWAVAEKTACEHERWSEFSSIWQGEGLLGERLSQVYDLLLARYPFVCFLGADSPHVPVEDLVTALIKVKAGAAFVLGESEDGGFYFFGGSSPVSRETWTSVEYSCSTTAAQLSNKLRPIAPISYINKNFDIDTIDDLRKSTHMSTVGLLPEQTAVINWYKTFLK